MVMMLFYMNSEKVLFSDKTLMVLLALLNRSESLNSKTVVGTMTQRHRIPVVTRRWTLGYWGVWFRVIRLRVRLVNARVVVRVLIGLVIMSRI